MFKTETHCHTNAVSRCASQTPKQQIEAYIECGYSTVIITEHFSDSSFEHIEGDWKNKIDHFLSGYKKAKEAAKGRIEVLLGMELRNIYNANDYLVYGITEEFLYKYNNNDENFLEMTIETFSDIAHENDVLLFQAHPFRNYMTITDHNILDGIEVYNGCVRHMSRNDICEMWAKKYNLLRNSGSDAHHEDDWGRGGFITQQKITNNKQLVEEMKRKPQLIITAEGFLYK
ncbi:MAG: PHP domain-containing protein [Eubacteriales bacterium]|nr:PHP domain-containing protein [Eubacteriales bacterium]